MKFNKEDLNKVAEEHNIGSGGGGGFLQLQEGDNKIRIVSEYEALSKHWNTKPPTVCVGLKEGCEYCSKNESLKSEGKDADPNNKANTKFMMWVIDRNDGEIKIAELGWTVVKPISELQGDEEYGFGDDGLPGYDVNVKKTVTGSRPTDTEYSVIPARKNVPLTKEEEAQVADLKPIIEIVEAIKNKGLDSQGSNEEIKKEDLSF